MMETLITQSFQTLALNSTRIIKSLDRIEARIKEIQEQKKDPSKAMLIGVAEEQMLWDNYVRLLEEFRLGTDAFMEGAHTQAKIQTLLKKGNGGNRPPSGVPGFRAKGEAIPI